jgi:hypothetical protein
MEVFEPVIKYTLKKNAEYIVELVDQQNLVGTGPIELTSDAKGVLAIELPEEWTPYYKWLSVTVKEVGPPAVTVLIDSVTYLRPYATVEQIAEYTQGKVVPPQSIEYERFARHIIDGVVGMSFQFERKSVKVLGNDTDSLVFNDRLGGAVFKVTENGSTVLYDSTDPAFDNFYVTPGMSMYSAFLVEMGDAGNSVTDNRLEHVPTWPTRYSTPLFRYEHDYVIDGEFGWAVVPQAIQDAALLLTHDIACGNNRYVNKYLNKWTNGQVTLSYDERVFIGTGNQLVDSMLEPFKMEAIRARAL